MGTTVRLATALSAILALTGCFATLHSAQSTSGGATTTVTSGQISGSASFSGGRVAFSSGQSVSSRAGGLTAKVTGNTAVVVVTGLVVADLVYYMMGPERPKPLAPGTRIADTCSCYKKESDEIKVTK